MPKFQGLNTRKVYLPFVLQSTVACEVWEQEHRGCAPLSHSGIQVPSMEWSTSSWAGEQRDRAGKVPQMASEAKWQTPTHTPLTWTQSHRPIYLQGGNEIQWWARRNRRNTDIDGHSIFCHIVTWLSTQRSWAAKPILPNCSGKLAILCSFSFQHDCIL